MRENKFEIKFIKILTSVNQIRALKSGFYHITKIESTEEFFTILGRNKHYLMMSLFKSAENTTSDMWIRIHSASNGATYKGFLNTNGTINNLIVESS